MNSRRLIASPEAKQLIIVAAQASIGKGVANFRFGSQADVSQCNRHVRFGPSGHCVIQPPSASAISEGGTVRPSALAALRLITKSNLVDCMTGRSAGFSPLRIRAA